jgi:hypothetical protein
MFYNNENCHNCNYIENGYYQLIYEADIAYLSGNRFLAYEKIKEAESKCPLIEQPMYYEIRRYVDLLIENNQFEKALEYIAVLVKDYGYQISFVEGQNYFQKLKQNTDWEKERTRLLALSDVFNQKLNCYLVDLLDTMEINDQQIRKQHPFPNRKNQEEIDKLVAAYDSVDFVNEKLLKNIFEKYGYPNIKMLGFPNQRISGSVGTMLMHFRNSSDSAYFKSKLLEFIEKGECPPIVLSSFVDSYSLSDTTRLKYTYGIYTGELYRVKDIENLNKRRLSIGMPTVRQAYLRDSLVKANIPFLREILTENDKEGIKRDSVIMQKFGL